MRIIRNMFTDKLFDHKYDIDTLLIAFCGDTHNGRWLLNSTTGEVITEAEQNAPTQHIADGANNNHWHVIEPLPISVLQELTSSFRFKNLEEEEQQAIQHIITSAPTMHALTTYFDNAGFAGGWLREQIKNIILEWLDEREMVPPSMRHVRDKSALTTLPNRAKVTIT